MRQRRLDGEKAQAEAAAVKEKSVDEALIEMYEADQRAAGIRKIREGEIRLGENHFTLGSTVL
jgi:hypothetical protein